MSSRLIDRDWLRVFRQVANSAQEEILAITPFIQTKAVEVLFEKEPAKIRVITRFNLSNFYDRVSDLDALKFLLDIGAEIKGVKNLHAKAYVIDHSYAIVTSANLTGAALHRNQEFGLLTSNTEMISVTRSYFERLWGKAGDRLTEDRLRNWREEIEQVQRRGGRRVYTSGLRDYGKDLGFVDQSETSQWIVKFLGRSDSRQEWDSSIFELVEEAECHWACAYPKGKRPRNVRDGAVIFMGWLVKDPQDILIFARAIGASYVEGRDDASESDKMRRAWKRDWPHYIRVRDAEFLRGTLSNGVSLYTLMEELGSDSFASTSRNARLGSGNTNPRKAYLRQASVELSPQAAAWLNSHLNEAFRNHGRISESDLEALGWPE